MITSDKDTIAAISTPVGFGGIGIVRISGPSSAHIARKIFRRKDSKEKLPENQKRRFNAKEIIPRRLHYGNIVDPEKKAVLNEVLMVFMPSPNSYTREDVIEIQAHGGTAALNAILEIVLRNGARLADPGEFTRRAYINGRIDLSQAEAIIDIIQAKTETSLRIANRILEGDVGKTARDIRESLLETKALLEAQIDFPEDVEENIEETTILSKITQEALGKIEKILDGYRHGRLFRDGARIVILGRSNVGKSSLLNRFMQRERAIVTSYPGTTRDSLEESINLFGIPAVIIDTAGWRNTKDPVEKIGIERSLEQAKNADLILFMVDAGSGVTKEDKTLYLQVKNTEKLLVINKSDLLEQKLSVEIPEEWSFAEAEYVSAKFGYGFEMLKEKLFKKLVNNANIEEIEAVPNIRQKNLFQKAEKAIEEAVTGLKERIPTEIISIEIQEAMDALDEITGETAKADILEEIFSRFCIGK